uniref:HECT domain-containing protein n=1 Tax=Sinocyclocheilus anshuiensis TaxID=1608454 RepID=A0A671SM75_9TELE
RTPKASDELILLQAGLGRRTVAIPEDADHSERKLNVVAPEVEGYTGSCLIKTVGGKARCAKCHTDMPVQLLAVHVQKCERDIWINSSDSESCFPAFVCKVSCPVCSALYSEDFIEVHASTCGERLLFLFYCLFYIGQKLKKNASLCFLFLKPYRRNQHPSTIFSVHVTREDMFSRGLTQWKRQKKSSPKNPLRVTFIGEPGIDSGALMKEFLTEMMAGIEEKFFEGGSTGKNFKYSITDFQNENFRIVGEIMAVSITQDGPPPNFFMEWIYNFISSGEINKDQLTKADITDADLLDLIDKIETADTTAFLDLSERIAACGYTGPLTCDRKEDIVSAVVLHSCVRILPMLQQMCRGLELYGLHEMVKQNHPLFQPLFVPGHFTKVSVVAYFLMMALSPILSEVGSVKRQRESSILRYGQHRLCYPLVNACSCTVTLPTRHLGTYTEFLGIMRQAVSNSREFGRS